MLRHNVDRYGSQSKFDGRMRHTVDIGLGTEFQRGATCRSSLQNLNSISRVRAIPMFIRMQVKVVIHKFKTVFSLHFYRIKTRVLSFVIIDIEVPYKLVIRVRYSRIGRKAIQSLAQLHPYSDRGTVNSQSQEDHHGSV